MSSNEGKREDLGEEELAMKLSQDSLRLPPSASTCQTCHKVASIRSFQKYPHFRFICACCANNFPDSGGPHHSGEGSAALEPERKLKISTDDEESKPTIDWTCKTCHQLASFQSFQSHPTLRLTCACGDNNFNGSGGHHHSGEGSAALEPERKLKISTDDEESKPTIDWTCKTCHQLASFQSFQSHPTLGLTCACGDNNFNGSGGHRHSGEGSAALDSERKLKTSIQDEGGSKPTIDWICRTCRQSTSFKSFQSQTPKLRSICACGDNNFDGIGGQHHSGEGSAALEPERKLKISTDDEGSKPTIDWTCKTCHQLASFKSFQSYPPLRFICACGDNNFDGSGGQHHSGEGGLVLESEKPLKTSIDEIGNRQPEIQGSSTPSITQISDSETGAGPREGGQGGQGDGFKGHCQPEIQGPGTSPTAQISYSEAGGGPGQDWQGMEVIREGIACPKCKDPVLHQAHRFEILKRELDQDREGGKGGQGDEEGNRQPESQRSGTSSNTHISNSETGGRPGAGEQGGQGGQVMRKEIVGQKFKDPVLHQPHLRYWILARQLDQRREGGQGGQGDEKGNRQPETQGCGTSSTTELSDSGAGGGPGEGGQGEQVMRKDIAGQQFKDPVPHQAHRFQIQKRELDQDREGGRRGQEEKGNRQPETQGSRTSSTTQILDSGTGGGPGEGGQGGQVMRNDIAGQQLKDPVLHQAKRLQILKREMDQDRAGGQGGQGDEKGNRQSETEGSGTSSTTKILDSGTGGGPGEGGQGGQVMRKDISGQQLKDPVLHQPIRSQMNLQRELDHCIRRYLQSLREDREGGQGGQGDETGNRQSETQGSGISLTTQILDSGTGGGRGEGGQGGQGGQGDETGNRQSETQGSGISLTTQILDSGTGGGPGEGGQGGQGPGGDVASPVDFPWQM